MSKYNRTQLKKMASIVLDARKLDDLRYMFLVVKVGVRTDLSVNEVKERLNEISKTGGDYA